MNLALVANVRMPSERANAAQTAYMAAAFAKAGAHVKLIYPQRALYPEHQQTPWEYYGLDQAFDTVKVPCIDVFSWATSSGFRRIHEPLAFWLLNLSFTFSAIRTLRISGGIPDVIYTRDLTAAYSLRNTRGHVFLESHQFPNSWLGRQLARFVLRDIGGVVCLTEANRAAWVNLGMGQSQVFTAPDGVWLNRFGRETRAEAREALGIEPDARIALYAGNLFPWKGIGTLLEAAGRIRGELWIVGGVADTASRWSPGEAKWLGYASPQAIPRYLAAADVLLLPNSARYVASRRDTSPLKLFEYMAARRPIVASATTAICEILNDSNAFLCPPDDPAALAMAVNFLFNDPQRGQRLAQQAREDVHEFTWERRANRIVEFIKQRIAYD